MKNAEQPIYPQNENWQNDMEKHLSNVGRYGKPSMVGIGLTKREQACIQLGIPKTGDSELDEIIMLAERKKMAAMAMQGLLSVYDAGNQIVPNTQTVKYMALLSITAADELLFQLQNEPNDKI
jgi:hypothetical protein